MYPAGNTDVRAAWMKEAVAMGGLPSRWIWSAAAALAAILTTPKAMAQGTPVAGYPTTSSSAPGIGMNMGMDMGMGFMPIPYGMFGSASLSPTDAAALGMPRPSSAGLGIGGMSNNVFSNPVSASMIYGSAYPMTPRQMGLSMLASQSQSLGIGSGQASGVRPVATASSSSKSAQQTNAKPRGTAFQPGGLAARYFHRSAPISRYPQSYYGRQNRYFPSITR
jgi:hypothetical protein